MTSLTLAVGTNPSLVGNPIRIDSFEAKKQSQTSHWSNLKRKIVNLTKPLTKPENLIRGYNAMIATAALASYIFAKEPVSLMEYGLDFLTHAVQAITSSNSPESVKRLAIALNIKRLAYILIHTSSHTTTIPYHLNMIDLLNHGMNLAALAWDRTLHGARGVKILKKTAKELIQYIE